MTSKQTLFVTGASRSGTSLLDKLLSTHPAMEILSQPLPHLYTGIKRRFLETARPEAPPPSDLARAFPLNDLFDTAYADPGRFTAYLHAARLDRDWLIATLRGMEGFSGQGIRPGVPAVALVPEEPPGTAAFIAHYLAAVSRRPDVRIRGSKEIFAEEFIAYLLQSGNRVILLLRDPRDVVASVFGPRGADYAGQGLPLLFVLRQWRKSVAFALEHADHPAFRTLRYEDLVTHPAEQLADLADWLGCGAFPDDVAHRQLVDHQGAPWLSNSSHRPVQSVCQDSIGRGHALLPKPLIGAIETLCFPELRALGYDPGEPASPAERRNALEAVAEPCPAPRPILGGYVWNRAALVPELQRLGALETRHFEPRLHLFETAFRNLLAPGRPRGHPAMDGRRFAFLVCSERSGSNLLTSALNGHSAISAPPPSHLFRLFASNARNYGSLENDDNWRTLLSDVTEAFDAQLGSWNTRPDPGAFVERDLDRSVIAPVVALYLAEAASDGADMIFVKENHTARFAAILQDQLPGCRFVNMVRDPRDVAASYLATEGIAGGIERAVEVWSADQTDTLSLQQRPGMERALHVLRYEDLLADPPLELTRITRFLGLDYDPAMLEFHRDARTRRNAQRIDAWKNLSQPIQRQNAGKYRHSLRPEEIEYIELRCFTLMKAFGYRPDIVTDAPDAETAAQRCVHLHPLLRQGALRIESAREIEIRARRLAMIETVKSRRLS